MTIEEILMEVLMSKIGEINDQITRDEVKSEVLRTMNLNSLDSFEVICDQKNNPEEDVLQNRLTVDVYGSRLYFQLTARIDKYEVHFTGGRHPINT